MDAMEDDTDPESRGVCALETLSKVAAAQAEEADEVDRPRNRAVTPVERTSAPLVPLVAPHKRRRSRSREPSKALRPVDSGVQKVRAPPVQASGQQDLQNEPGSPTGNQGLQQQRRSAPERGHNNSNVEKDLRGSKSAPDLGAHALAAIRSIQAGTLQLDSRMRSKIAAAAKKVLEARELKRRVSSENVAQAATASQAEPMAAATPPPQQGGSHLTGSTPSQWLNSGTQPVEVYGGNGTPLPQSLATAAAIARGEVLPVSKSSARAGQGIPSIQDIPEKGVPAVSTSVSPTSSSGHPHHANLNTGLQPVSSPTSSYRPFTVTTGVPRFAQGLGPPAMAPSTPQGPSSQMLQMSPPPTRTSSLALSAGETHIPVQTSMSE